ncbi:MAG: D-sedoheptulose 7-phosphate isomerase [Succinivibrionaceae bacterium]|nr:D-sedoheptulose 7-phosphate isomerase [Succinivibrionaceae bacterium]
MSENQTDLEALAKGDLDEARQVLEKFLGDENNIKEIVKAAEMMAEAIRSGGKIISCGNGGSHCDAMHFAEELTGRYREDRPPYAAIAISDPSHLSCVSNDFGYDHVFSRYVEALGRPGDCLLAISTSGHSKNVVEAAELARRKGMKVVGLTGKNGGLLYSHSDSFICVRHYGFADRTQEIHIKVIHILIRLIETMLKEEQPAQ